MTGGRHVLQGGLENACGTAVFPPWRAGVAQQAQAPFLEALGERGPGTTVKGRVGIGTQHVMPLNPFWICSPVQKKDGHAQKHAVCLVCRRSSVEGCCLRCASVTWS